MIQAATGDFINETTIGTFAVATGGIVAVCVVFRKVFKINHPIVPLLCSLAISIALAYTKGTHTLLGWIIAILNAALLFCASIGANELGAERPKGGGEQQGGEKMPWFKSYFKRAG